MARVGTRAASRCAAVAPHLVGELAGEGRIMRQSSSLGSGSRSSRPGQSSRDTRRRFGGEVAVLEPLEGRVLLSGSPELLKDINALTFGSDIRDIVGVGGTAFFLVHNDFYSGALWKSDGTAAGTAPVARFGPSEAFSSPQNLT